METLKVFLKNFWQSMKAEIVSLWLPFSKAGSNQATPEEMPASQESNDQIEGNASKSESTLPAGAIPLHNSPIVIDEIQDRVDEAFAEFFLNQSGDNWKFLIQNAKAGGTNSVAAAKILNSTINRLDAANTSINEMLTSINEILDTIFALEKLSMKINSLSDQSKIVSLNAFVEAFKAKDQGKTFAVVANELGALSGSIKKLTGNVQRSLKSIDAKITENKNYCYDVAEFFTIIDEELSQFKKLMMRIEELSVSQSNSFQDFEIKMQSKTEKKQPVVHNLRKNRIKAA